MVQQGEGLFALARRFGVSVSDLASANGIAPDARLQLGQALALPGGSWSAELGVRVVQPSAGARVRSPIAVLGSAAAFEGSVIIEALGADGARLARATTQAKSPDAGAHGLFQTSIELPPASSERAVTLRFYWPSPRDGSPRDEVKVVVTVLPS